MNSIVQDFRKNLKDFEREIANQNSNCCNTGVSMVQCHLLIDIEKNEPISITKLAEFQGLDKSTISRTVDALYNGGYLNREVNPQSRRQSIVSLTQKGKEKCKEINDLNDSFFFEIFNSIPKEELICFNSVFGKLTNKMKHRREDQIANSKCCD